MSDTENQEIPVESMDEGLASPDEESLAAPAEDEVVAPVEDEVVAPVEDEVVAPVEDEAVAPLEEPAPSSEQVEEVVESPPPEVVGAAGEPQQSHIEEVMSPSTESVSEPAPVIVATPVSDAKETPAKETPSACCGIAGLAHPRIVDLICWRNPVSSAVTLCSLTSVLVLLRSVTILSVVSLWMLCMLMVAVSFRVVVATVLTFQKKPLTNPLEQYLHVGLPVEEEKVVEFVSCAVSRMVAYCDYVRRCLLIEDVGASFKFFFKVLGVYQLTGFMNVLTIVTIALLAAFAIPPLYERNQAAVDGQLKVIKEKLSALLTQARAVPVMGKLLPKEKAA